MARREALEAAFDATDEGTDVAAAVDQAVAEATQEDRGHEGEVAGEGRVAERPERDEAGRFQGRNDRGAKVEKPVEDQYSKPPKSWRSEMHAQYPNLPPEVRKYLHQREEEQNKGVEPLKNRAARADLLEQSLGPVMQDLQARGVGVDAFLRDIAQTVMVLSRGTIEQKVATLNSIARQYGVIAAQGAVAAAGNTGDPRLARLEAQLNGMQAERQAEHQRQEQAEWDWAASQVGLIEQNSEKYPYFSEVRVTMGRLIQTGEAKSLDSAYNKAIRLHDGIWAKEQERQNAAAAQKRREEANRAAQAARRGAVSPRSSSPAAEAPSVRGKVDRRSALSAAFDDALGSGGRI